MTTPLIRGRYRVVRQLSATTYGGIFLCDDELQPPRQVALKSVSLPRAIRMIERRDPQRQAPDDPRQERAVAAWVRELDARHPSLVRYLDDFVEGPTLYFVLEYCGGGDLFSNVNQGRNRRLRCADALALLQQVASGVQFLHHRGLAHRDLSLENVLLTADGRCKIADFGLCARADRLCADRVGKAYYMAPEVVSLRSPYDPRAADVWSLGIVLFILLTGSPLVALASSADKAFCAFASVGVREVLSAWKMSTLVSREAMALLDGMLQCDPVRRLTIDEVVGHASFTDQGSLGGPYSGDAVGVSLTARTCRGVVVWD